MDGDTLCRTLARNICDAHFAGFQQCGRDGAHWRVDSMLADADSSQIRESCHQPDRAVHAHAKVTDIIEEDHPRGTTWFYRFAQKSSDNNF